MQKIAISFFISACVTTMFAMPFTVRAEGLGSWQSGFNVNTTYTASTDGFVLVTSTEGGDQDCNVKIESPVGVLRLQSSPNHDGVQIAETVPVRRGDSWRVVYTNTGCSDKKIFWIPFDGNLGPWSSGGYTTNQSYTAVTDGFVLVTSTEGGDQDCNVVIETPVGTTRLQSSPNDDGVQIAETSPVRRGDSWRVRYTNTGCGTTANGMLKIFWIPFDGNLGPWSSGGYTTNQSYTAVTDGFVLVTSTEGGDQDCNVVIETPVGTTRLQSSPNDDGVQIAETSPVRRGDSWRVRYTNTGCGTTANGMLKIFWISYTPVPIAPPSLNGTIIQKATINSVEQPVSFVENYTKPDNSSFTVTLNLPATFTNMPAGTWSINTVTPLDSSLRLTSITGCSPLLPPCSVTLAPEDTITVTYNFDKIPQQEGVIKIRATLDGKDWNSPPFLDNYTHVYPDGSAWTGDVTIDPPQDFTGATTGTYTVNSIVPPSGVTFKNVNGFPLPYGQTLSAGGTITFTFNFTTPVVAVPTLTISPLSATVPIGGTQQFNTIYDPDGTGPQYPQYVTNFSGWSSSSDSIATVSSMGVATGKSAGSATITASYSGLTASASLTVTAPTPTLVVSPSSASVPIGGTKQFTATYDSDGSGPNSSQDVTAIAVWSPSDAAKVTVNNGLATRIGHGMTSVSASYSGLSRSATIIDPAVLNVRPTPNDLIVGGFVQLNAYLDPDGSGPMQEEVNPVTASSNWSSNRSFAPVDSVVKGKVNAVSAGTNARITANYQGIAGSARVDVATVPPPPDPELSVSCSASPISTITGQPVVWTATATGGTGSYSYLWSGSSPLGGKTGNPATARYTTTGTKTGSVTVTSGSQVVTQPCTTQVTVETPPPPPPPPTVTLSANPGIIDKGNSSTLTWSSTNADSCTAMGGFDTGGATSGNKDVSPSTTSDYQISCTGPGDSVNSNIVTVTVVSVAASISASPSCITGGGSSRISWGATPAPQVASCTVSGPGLSSSQVSGSQMVNVTSKSTYDIACITMGGSTVTKSVIVDVAGCFAEF